MTLMSVDQVAKLYGFSSSQIRRLIREGKLKAQKVGMFYAIDAKDVKNLKKRRHDNRTTDKI